MPDTLIPETENLEELMLEMGRQARQAALRLSSLSADQRSQGLQAMKLALQADADEILSANQLDLQLGREKGLSPAMMDRLALDPSRLDQIAESIGTIAEMADPVGREIDRWRVASGLDIARVRTPLGVIGIIYEARPNVTADAAALCLRSANAAILRAGSESLHSARAIVDALQSGLEKAGLPPTAIQLVNTPDRSAVGHMLAGLQGQIDVIVPRGGKSLVARVQAEARIPVIGHLEGLCHIYIHSAADLGKAIELVLNAKLRRTGICGAVETVLIDQEIAAQILPPLCQALQTAGCEIRGDAGVRAIVPDVSIAVESDWRTEYLAAILSIKLVDDLQQAMAHIETYGTGHTECIVTEDTRIAERFLAGVDAGIVMHNASTQYADGGEFGMGAEIGIATGRVHARGPVGAEQLTLFKYIVRGTGQIRP